MDRSSELGFLGLGNLGLPMARTLLGAGWRLRVLDPVAERAEQCKSAGADVAAGVVDLRGCPVVALAVPDDGTVNDVMLGEEGLLAVLSPGAVVVLHSTVLPRTAVNLFQRGADRSIAVVDAPVSGGPEGAAAGELTLMVGGDAQAVSRVEPLLRTVGSQVFHVGGSGAGAAVKLANQLMMFSALAGAQEALALTASFGVADSDVLDAVGTGLGGSWVASNWGFFDHMADAYDRTETPLSERSWSKDLWDVVATARERNLQLPVAALLSQILANRVEAHAREARRASVRRQDRDEGR